MGISGSVYSRPAKFSTIIADADLDIGARAILTTDLCLYQGVADEWYIKNRNKSVWKNMNSNRFIANDVKTDVVIEGGVGHGVSVDGLLIKDYQVVTLEGVGGACTLKKVSDNLKNSHDVEVDTPSTGATYVKVKTMTFTHGIKGNLRVKFQRKSNNASYTVYGAVYKNGVLLGTPCSGSQTAYQDCDEDIDVGEIAAGGTLELWGKAEHASSHVLLQHFRCYYDTEGNAADMVTS